MVIRYKNRKLEKECTDAYEAGKKYGKNMAEKLQQRVDEIDAAISVEMMIQFKIGRCHPLNGDRKGQYAVDLVHPFRLIFEKEGNEVQIVLILEIIDYHKK